MDGWSLDGRRLSFLVDDRWMGGMNIGAGGMNDTPRFYHTISGFNHTLSVGGNRFIYYFFDFTLDNHTISGSDVTK